MRKAFLVLAVLLVILSLSMACRAKPTPTPVPTPTPTLVKATPPPTPTPTLTPKTLKIGTIGPFSGGSAPWGLNMLHNLEMKVEEVNNAGGLVVAGQPYKIQVIAYDHKARADEATAVAKKLIFDDGVKYIIGNAVGATTDAAQLVTEENKVIFTFGSWGKKSLGPDKPYSFRSQPGSWEVALPFYEWVAKRFPRQRP